MSLDAALSGLRAAQRSLDLISGNIANASTEGYTRKILPQESLVVGGNGLGVKVQAIVRNVDRALLRDVFRQLSLSEGYGVREQYLTRIQDFHGPSEAERSIAAHIGKLADAFSELSSAPDSPIALSKTLSVAEQTVTRFREFTAMITQMRNQTEEEIHAGVVEINQALELIADLNVRISNLTAQGQSAANLEDQRDSALRTISQYMEISTYSSENNKLVVMTKQGQTLADEQARQLSFDKNTVLPTSYYPGGGLSGIFLDSTASIELDAANLGGSIGALLALRDETLPAYQAQIDELAQKLAQRFDSQGLRLFTDQTGTVPANVPDPGLVGYVGFAAKIQINVDIQADMSLIRTGTYGQAVLVGSNETIRKISEFAFGAYEYQEAQGTADISAGTLFASLGLTQSNEIFGNRDLTDYLPDLDAAPNIAAPADFSLDLGGGPFNVTVNPGDTATDLVNNINLAAGFGAASLNGLGQLVLSAPADITIADVSIGAAGMADLGFSFGAYPAQNPSFTVQVGTQSPVTVFIDPADTAADLLATLNAVSGLDAALGGGGELVLTPELGGDLTLLNVTGTPLNAMGITVVNVAHAPFRQNNLGPDGSASTDLLEVTTLEDFARSVITDHAEDHGDAKERREKEQVFFETLDKRNKDISGVDLDQEISELVRVQTAYTAAARMITATERMFDDLLAAFTF